MTNTPTSHAAIRAITQARLSHSAPRSYVDTATSLTFALDHARAREAVNSELDLPRLTADLETAALDYCVVTSSAQQRDVFITRPDLRWVTTSQ